ncbi:MAG: serine hydrolase, partial [Candidatus Aenigmarchaeota archaeon]|nr:serine hydrolase [Candidatus Aenigmarchaeota archaeon]
SNILRALYLSTYLHRSFSQLALSMMSETDYTNQLQAGIPADIKVAHKIGFYATGGYYHDCGIVYVPDKPYIVCVMSRDSTPQEANVAISGISGIVYRYVTTGSAA